MLTFSIERILTHGMEVLSLEIIEMCVEPEQVSVSIFPLSSSFYVTN
jgi:hypothetical protein